MQIVSSTMNNKPWDLFPSLSQPLTSTSEEPGKNERLAIVGAGLSGCWLARILAEQGIAVTLYEQQDSVAAAASGNPAGIAKPFVTRSHSQGMAFHCLAHQYLLSRLELFNLEEAAQFSSCGVLQLVEKPYPDSDNYESLSALEAKHVAGVSLHSPALNFTNAGWLNPKNLCCSLTDHPLITLQLGHRVSGIVNNSEPLRTGVNDHSNTDSQRSPDVHAIHKLHFDHGDSARVEHVVLATGSATQLLPEAEHLPLTAARGQISRYRLGKKASAPRCVLSGKHYVIPDGNTVLVGATFDRNNDNTQVLENDHAANLQGLQQLLPTLNVDPKAVTGYAGVRATTPDRLPLAGPLADFAAASEIYRDIRHGRALAHYPRLPCRTGIYLLGGLGSRGIVTAPLCAQLLADHLTGQVGTLDKSSSGAGINDSRSLKSDYGTLESWAPLLNPARFMIRHLKRATSH